MRVFFLLFLLSCASQKKDPTKIYIYQGDKELVEMTQEQWWQLNMVLEACLNPSPDL